MAAHRFWRLMHIFNDPAVGFANLCEFYLRQSPGGANEVPVASAASSQYLPAFGPEKSYDGDNTTCWRQFFGDENPDCWVSYDYGAPIDPVEMYQQSPNGGGLDTQASKTFDLQYSDVSLTGPWTTWKSTGFADPWLTGGQIQVQDLTVPTPFITATKAAITTVYSFTSPFTMASKLAITSVVSKAPPVEVTKLAYVAVVLGHNAHPEITPWTWEIDGHEYVAFQLQEETLVYDFHAERWYVWGSGDLPLWAPQTGQNWNADLGTIIAALGGERVSNVICGDGTTSALYFLDPDLDEDYSPLGVANVPFVRIMTGQLTHRGKDYKRLYGVQVNASNGFSVDAADLSVTLDYSDDQGVTYNTFGSLDVTVGDYAPLLRWDSLGSYRSPGRLLRLKDYGALRRVDDWTTPDG